MSSASNYRDADIICNCLSIHYNKIKEAINDSCTNLNQISKNTGAGSVCGQCSSKVLELLGQSDWTYATIKFNQKYTEDIYSFFIKPLYKNISNFIPGQYIGIKIQIDNLWIERFYTITSATKSKEESYEIIVKKYHKGVFSPWLFDNKEKTLFTYISKPNGNFILRETYGDKAILCFAGGVGITPFIAFIRGIMSDESGIYSKAKLFVFYSIRDKKLSIIPKDVAEFLKKSNNVTLKLWISSENGRLGEKAIANILSQFNPEFVYICGSNDFEVTVIDSLAKSNFPKDKVFTESFYLPT